MPQSARHEWATRTLVVSGPLARDEVTDVEESGPEKR